MGTGDDVVGRGFIAPGMTVFQTSVIHPQLMQNPSEQIRDGQTVLDRSEADVIGFPVDTAPFETAS